MSANRVSARDTLVLAKARRKRTLGESVFQLFKRLRNRSFPKFAALCTISRAPLWLPRENIDSGASVRVDALDCGVDPLA